MSNEQLIALGELAYWSGQAEAGVRYFLELLINGPAGEVISRGRSFTEMIDLIRRLLPTRPEFRPIAPYVDEDIERLRKTMDVRNLLLHGFWDSAEVPHGSSLSVTVNRRRGTHAMQNLTASEIQNAAQDLANACTLQFATLFDAHEIEAGRQPREHLNQAPSRKLSNDGVG